MHVALVDVENELQRLADPADAEALQRYFKTGPGEYGDGDRFMGIRVPQIRALARNSRALAHEQVLVLLRSPWHEARLLALHLLVEQHRRGTPEERATIHEAYLGNTRYINNWDLVDTSAEHIIGPHFGPENLAALERLAGSTSLWERRMAVLATFYWIRQKDFGPILHVAHLLLHDPHDLIHKAVGWMLREVGKRDIEVEEEFLRRHYRTMPRTMLRYAIERLPESRRRKYLQGEI